MDGFEWNKVAGGVLAAVLAVTVIGQVGDILVQSKELDKPVVEIATATSGEAAEAGDDESAAGESVIALLASADPDKGQKAAKKCAACHSFDQGGKNKVGPNLWNIVGATMGQVAGFAYSEAMSTAGGQWDYEALDGFLAKPKAYMPGTKMAFAGVKKTAQRADLIAYLRSLSESPQPLPEVASESASDAEPPSTDAESPSADAEPPSADPAAAAPAETAE